MIQTRITYGLVCTNSTTEHQVEIYLDDVSSDFGGKQVTQGFMEDLASFIQGSYSVMFPDVQLTKVVIEHDLSDITPV